MRANLDGGDLETLFVYPDACDPVTISARGSTVCWTNKRPDVSEVVCGNTDGTDPRVGLVGNEGTAVPGPVGECHRPRSIDVQATGSQTARVGALGISMPDDGSTPVAIAASDIDPASEVHHRDAARKIMVPIVNPSVTDLGGPVIGARSANHVDVTRGRVRDRDRTRMGSIGSWFITGSSSAGATSPTSTG